MASLARQLFDGLQPLHKLPQYQGKLLEAAAYLHDIGHYVSDTGHHKHSAYLVEHGDMPGFTDSERHFVAMLCRYHRKAMPAQRHSSYQTLDTEARRSLTLLTPLLRLADSLDRGHRQRVEAVQCELKDGQGMIIGLRAKGDSALEQWAAERAAEAFRQVYNVPMAVSRLRATS